MPPGTRLSRAARWAKPVLGSRYLWLGLLGLVSVLVVLYLGMNHVVMPVYTRHGVEVSVPETRELSFEQAEEVLEEHDLRAERREQPFNPNLPRDVVVDQNPAPNARVKPGRKIYLFVNSGPRERVTVPDVLTLSESLARRELTEAGLTEIEVREDSLYSPYEGTVTRQEPRPGNALPADARVTLWVSPGLNEDRTVTVPDVRGASPDEARAALLEAGLWVDPTRSVGGTITRQEPEPGAGVPEGTEVRVFSELLPEPPPEEIPEDAGGADVPEEDLPESDDESGEDGGLPG